MHDALNADQRWESSGNLFEGRRVRRELPELTRQLAILLRSGERLDRALATLAEFSRARRLREALLAVRDDVRAGDPLSVALRRHPDLFSDFYAGVVAVGEAGGDLAGGVRKAAEHLLRQQRFAGALATALTYPMLLLAMTGLSLVVLLVYVLPQFRELFDDTGVHLPWITRALLGLSESLRIHGWVLAVAAGALIVGARVSLRQPETRRRWHRFQLRIPLVSELVRRIEVARFAGALADALSGGVPLVQALRLSQSSISNLHVRGGLDAVVDDVKEGGRLGEGLHRNSAFPPLAVHMIQVGEDSGRLVESLRDAAEVYDGEFDAAVKRLLNVLEPALILIIGSGIALVILAMISAIQRLNTLPI